MVVLGIDAGGTKTVCQMADAEGNRVAESRGPGATLQSAGELQVEKVLHQVIQDVLSSATSQPAVVCLGMAGIDRPDEAGIAAGILNRLAPRSDVLVVNDALIALEAGAPGVAGVVIIAGTGSIAYGRDDRGRAARSGGWGYVLGDEGSGYWLGRLALRAVVRASDGRGPATSLTPRVLAHYKVKRAQDLVREIYYGGFKPSSIATLASDVEGAATEGDEVAVQLIHTGARELAAAAVSVSRRLQLERGPVILAGGIFRAVKPLRDAVVVRLTAQLPAVSVTHLQDEPAQGAVRLALARAAGTLVLPTYLESEA